MRSICFWSSWAVLLFLPLAFALRAWHVLLGDDEADEGGAARTGASFDRDYVVLLFGLVAASLVCMTAVRLIRVGDGICVPSTPKTQVIVQHCSEASTTSAEIFGKSTANDATASNAL